MQESVKGVLSYLDDKATAGYTGGIKMGFEDGRPTGFAETDNPDTTIKKVKADFDIEERVKKACNPKYYGTIFLVYENGLITHCCSNKTMNGKVLDEMLQGYSQYTAAPPKKRVAVVVKRG
ncbi:MAG: hypothetical protein LBH43_12815 [Treponema sp.]|jgi:hypothetical protein|nr:hypothetical protein [Treponema sp.]